MKHSPQFQNNMLKKSRTDFPSAIFPTHFFLSFTTDSIFVTTVNFQFTSYFRENFTFPLFSLWSLWNCADVYSYTKFSPPSQTTTLHSFLKMAMMKISASFPHGMDASAPTTAPLLRQKRLSETIVHCDGHTCHSLSDINERMGGPHHQWLVISFGGGAID